jgi:chromosome segregation ATPase
LTIENQELVDRLAAANLHISELKTIKDTFESELLARSEAKYKLIEEHQAEIQAIHEREKQTVASLQQTIIGLETRVAEFTGREQLLTTQIQILQKSVESQTIELEYKDTTNSQFESQIQLISAQLEAEQSKGELQNEQLRIYKERVDALFEELSQHRLQIAQKDSSLQMLHDRLKLAQAEQLKLQQQITAVKSNKSKSSAKAKSSPTHTSLTSSGKSHPLAGLSPVEIFSRYDNLSQQLIDAREASLAHQTHSSFMQSEVRAKQFQEKFGSDLI